MASTRFFAGPDLISFNIIPLPTFKNSSIFWSGCEGQDQYVLAKELDSPLGEGTQWLLNTPGDIQGTSQENSYIPRVGHTNPEPPLTRPEADPIRDPGWYTRTEEREKRGQDKHTHQLAFDT